MDASTLARPKVEIGGIFHHDIAGMWPEVWPLLAPAVERSEGRVNEAELLDGCRDRSMQLWTASLDGKLVAAWVTRIITYPGVKVCKFLFCGGRDQAMPHWLEKGLAMTEAWASAQGCELMEMVGRHGWERAMGNTGYHKSHIIMEKRLDPVE